MEPFDSFWKGKGVTFCRVLSYRVTLTTFLLREKVLLKHRANVYLRWVCAIPGGRVEEEKVEHKREVRGRIHTT